MNLFVVFFLLLTLNAPTSVCIFSILLSIYIYIYIYIHPKAMTRRIFLVCDHFLYSHDLNVWFSGDIVGRNTFDLETWGEGGGSQRFCYIITMITTLPLYSVGDDWFPVRSPRKPWDSPENPPIWKSSGLSRQTVNQVSPKVQSVILPTYCHSF